VAVKRDQTLHERLIPLLVEGIGATTYLELGTFDNATISKVRCRRRIGVDKRAVRCPDVQMFEMRTDRFIENHAKRVAPFDFVFIDADHSAASVEADFHGIWPYVSDEGIVCLHDTNPETEKDTAPGLCGDAWRFAKRLSSTVECVTLPYHPGLTIIRKRVQWGPK